MGSRRRTHSIRNRATKSVPRSGEGGPVEPSRVNSAVRGFPLGLSAAGGGRAWGGASLGGPDHLWAELAWGRGRDQSGGGASLGGGAERLRRAARRLDDRDKMATLQGGLLESDPGALSPAQLEQLRDLKVGAPPPPPPPQELRP